MATAFYAPLKAPAERPKTAAGAAPAARPLPETSNKEEETRKQSSLSGLERRERAPTSQQNEDILDIPTFLRRQAN